MDIGESDYMKEKNLNHGSADNLDIEDIDLTEERPVENSDADGYDVVTGEPVYDTYADEDDAEDDEYDFGDDEVLYEVKCPTCGEEITIDEQMLDEGSTVCPNCGEELEFDLEEDEEPKE